MIKPAAWDPARALQPVKSMVIRPMGLQRVEGTCPWVRNWRALGWGLLVNSGKNGPALAFVWANPPPLLERTRRRFGIVEHFKNGKQLRNLEQVATRWLTAASFNAPLALRAVVKSDTSVPRPPLSIWFTSCMFHHNFRALVESVS